MRDIAKQQSRLLLLISASTITGAYHVRRVTSSRTGKTEENGKSTSVQKEKAIIKRQDNVCEQPS